MVQPVVNLRGSHQLSLGNWCHVLISKCSLQQNYLEIDLIPNDVLLSELALPPARKLEKL